jgi:propanol-preferring alcohol dehydrogenase
MKDTYKAVEVSAPGVLRVVERQVSKPGAGQVRIRVEACGICHTDAATVMGIYPGLTMPRVPGYEVIGRIEALGAGVSRWKIGQRVGVGLIAGEDGVCEPCRRGDIVSCQNPVVSGVTVDGGYAEVEIKDGDTGRHWEIADRTKNVEELYTRHERVEHLRRAICRLHPTQYKKVPPWTRL